MSDHGGRRLERWFGASAGEGGGRGGVEESEPGPGRDGATSGLIGGGGLHGQSFGGGGGGGSGGAEAEEDEEDEGRLTSDEWRRRRRDAELMPPPSPPRVSNASALPPPNAAAAAAEDAAQPAARSRPATDRPATPEGNFIPAPGFNLGGTGDDLGGAAHPQPRRAAGAAGDTTAPVEAGAAACRVVAVSTPGWGTPGLGPGDTCSICLSKMPDGLREEEKRAGPDRQRRLRCGHLFHGACIDAWAAKHPTCPLCVHPISPQPPGLALN